MISNEFRYTFESAPIGAVFALMVIIALLAIELGLWLGKRSKPNNASLQPVATVVAALLGIVYAYGLHDRLRLVQRRAETLQDLMWSHVESLAETASDSRIEMQFASALTEVFNLHTKRVVLGAYYQIPVFVWIALLLASTVAMFAVGFQFEASGGRRIVAANLALSLTFALVMLLAIPLTPLVRRGLSEWALW